MSMLKEIQKSLFKKKATVLYPFKEREKVHIPEGLRGKIAFDREKCTGCLLCSRFCPSGACEIVTDEKGKRPVFHLELCLFCSQCQEVCPKGAIKLTEEFELAAFDKKAFTIR